MAKARKTVNHPWVQAAVFCDQIVEDRTGSISVIRIIDRFTMARPEGWDGKTHLMLPLNVLLAFKAGDVKGERTLTIYLTSPKNKRKKLFQKGVEFFGTNISTNIKLTVQFQFKTEGTHWFDIFVGKWLATRMPLTVVLQQQTETQQGEQLSDRSATEKQQTRKQS
jgi:hypothetical protein